MRNQHRLFMAGLALLLIGAALISCSALAGFQPTRTPDATLTLLEPAQPTQAASPSQPAPSPTPRPTSSPAVSSTSTLAPTPTVTLTPVINPIDSALEGVASGQGAPGAAAYNAKEPGPHPIVLLTASGLAYSDWNERLPHDWVPSTLGQAELVAVIGPEQEKSLELQIYSGGSSITAYSFSVDLELREARTGQTVAKATYTGTDPRPFPKTAPVDQFRLDGSHFEYAFLEDWLCPSVIGQGCWMSGRTWGGRAAGEPAMDFTAGFYLPLTYDEMKQVPGPTPVDFSPDGQTMARVVSGKSVQFLRVSDGAPLRTVSGNGAPIHSLAFSPDGQSLAMVATSGSVRVWRVSDGAPLFTLTGYLNGVTSVAFSPDGQMLAVVSDDQLNVYRVSDGTVLTTPVLFASGVNDAAFSPDGQTLAVGTRQGTVSLYRVSDGTLLRQIGGWSSTNRIIRLAFSRDGQTMVGATATGLFVWRLSGGATQQSLQGQGSADSPVAISPDGQMLAIWSSDGAVHLWQMW